jgi:hypothetical protein
MRSGCRMVQWSSRNAAGQLTLRCTGPGAARCCLPSAVQFVCGSRPVSLEPLARLRETDLQALVGGSHSRSKPVARGCSLCSSQPPRRRGRGRGGMGSTARAREMVALAGRRACCSHHGRIGERRLRSPVKVPDDSLLSSPARAGLCFQAHSQEESLSQDENR